MSPLPPDANRELMEKNNKMLLAVLRELQAQRKTNEKSMKYLRSISTATNVTGLVYLLGTVFICIAGALGISGLGLP